MRTKLSPGSAGIMPASFSKRAKATHQQDAGAPRN